jgi:hypothetical protein
MVPEVGIAPTSPRLQRGVNLPQLPEFRARRHHFDARLALLTASILSLVVIVQTKNPAHIAVSRVFEIL